MEKDEIIYIQSVQDYIKFLGYRDKQEQEEATGFKIANNGWSSEYFITYTDPFYNSILRDSYIITKGIAQKILADFKKKTQYRRSKMSRMESMRVTLIQEMRKFLTDIYGIPAEAIDDRDFVFKGYSQVRVGEAQFSFNSTYSSVDISMNKYSRGMEYAMKNTDAIFKFYYGVEASKIELTPLIRYED